MAVDNVGSAEQDAAAVAPGPAVLDPRHAGDIVGALGTLRQTETGNTRSWRRKLRLLLAACAFGLAHTPAFGNFADLGSTAAELERYVGHGAGGLLALAALDGSLIGANLTALTISYTLGDVSGKTRHSLHWKPRQAPFFYGLYGGLVGLSAIVTVAGAATSAWWSTG